MKASKIRNSILLVITAMIWGIAFVAQSSGGNVVGAYSFNAIRSLMGALFLIPVIFILDRLKLNGKKPVTKADKYMLLKGGISCGIVLFIASTFQQLGITMGSGAGKAGFLTACYILLVPVLGMLFHKKCGVNVWIGVFLSCVGLYLLCIKGSMSFRVCDILVLICALCFSIHIMVIDYFSPLVDGVRMSFIQFLTCGILGIIPMCLFEVSKGMGVWAASFATLEAWIPLCYAGIMSCGVAYTLQIIGQNGLNPTVASLLMSLESVFSVVAGAVILNERMTVRELIGCALIFVAIILAQISVKKPKVFNATDR